MFDTEQFIDDCLSALADSCQKAVREVVARAVSDPAAVIKGLGAPERGGLQTLYNTKDLTVLNLTWAPRMMLPPHDHKMWAVIGIYTGREDNVFWRRIEDENGSRLEAAGAKALGEKDVAPLGQDIVHSVTNPIPRLTGAIHVYGGDFFADGRSQWDPETLREQPYDVEHTLRLFEEANAYAAAG